MQRFEIINHLIKKYNFKTGISYVDTLENHPSKNKIVSDNYNKECDFYLYAGNIAVHPIELNICMP